MLRELTNSIKAILYERAVSPLSGVIAVVWVAFNWKPLSVLLWGSDDITDRIAYIDAHYVDAWRNLYYPAFVSVLVLAIYPFISLLAYALWEKVASWKLQLKQNFEGTVALPVSKSIAIWTEIREKDKQFNVAIEAKDNRIIDLEKQNQAISSELGNLKESLSKGNALEVEIAKRTEQLARAEVALRSEVEQRDMKERELAKRLEIRDAEIAKLHDQVVALAANASKQKELEEGELKILLAIGGAEEKDSLLGEVEVIKEVGLTKVEGNYYIDRLKAKNFIAAEIDREDDSEFLVLRQPGREYLIHHLKRKKAAISKAPPPIKTVS